MGEDHYPFTFSVSPSSPESPSPETNGELSNCVLKSEMSGSEQRFSRIIMGRLPRQRCEINTF
jgi:hypothetical protein